MSLGRSFTRLWLSQGLSNMGDGLVLAAVPLLAVAVTRDPLLIGGITWPTAWTGAPSWSGGTRSGRSASVCWS
jgi:hypothetical protein